jgi:hypothetical protein
MMRTHQSFIDRCFKDTHGRVVVYQHPNPPLVIWLIATAATFFLSHVPPLNRGFHALAFGALFTWAWLELVGGVNYFRRTLGVLILIYLLVSAASKGVV